VSNVAVTVADASTVTLHAPVPVQPPPLQPVKVDPIAVTALSVTTLPVSKLALHVGAHVMPDGADVTDPLP